MGKNHYSLGNVHFVSACFILLGQYIKRILHKDSIVLLILVLTVCEATVKLYNEKLENFYHACTVIYIINAFILHVGSI